MRMGFSGSEIDSCLDARSKIKLVKFKNYFAIKTNITYVSTDTVKIEYLWAYKIP